MASAKHQGRLPGSDQGDHRRYARDVTEENAQIITEQVDADVVDTLHQLLEDLKSVVSEYDAIHRTPTPKGSLLGADNVASDPEQIGHFVSYCMLQAVDTCRSITRVVGGADGQVVLPIMSVFTLARSVVECSATAIWVLQPADRKSRVVRRLQIGHNELTHETELVKQMATSFDASSGQAAVRDDSSNRKQANRELRSIAAANAIAVSEYENRFPGWSRVVDAAGQHLDDPGALLAIWRICSGMSHPSLSRGLNLLTFNERMAQGNVLRGTLSVKPSNVVGVLSVTYLSVRHALDAWREAKRAPNDEHPVPSPQIA